MDKDFAVRVRAFDWLRAQTKIHGDVLPRILLQTGFEFEGQRVPLVSPQGIFKPRILDMALSITTAPKGPYDDSFGEDGLLIYQYRGSDPLHRDNVALRKTMAERRPLIYFHGIIPGQYLAVWPVYLVGDDPQALCFKVAADDMTSVRLGAEQQIVAEGTEARRIYLTRVVKARLHQRGFREKVLLAYRSQCAFCRLKHRELLDAAHIIPDHLPDGKPVVQNGLSLCKLHHAAFDSFMLGVSPDYKIIVRDDILQERDGPLLLHGLQELHESRLTLPRSRGNWPDRDALAWRYEQYQAAG